MKLDLKRGKLQWQKNKDIANRMGWIIDLLDSDENYEDEEGWNL
jgi:hypothetical protein